MLATLMLILLDSDSPTDQKSVHRGRRMEVIIWNNQMRHLIEQLEYLLAHSPVGVQGAELWEHINRLLCIIRESVCKPECRRDFHCPYEMQHLFPSKVTSQQIKMASDTDETQEQKEEEVRGVEEIDICFEVIIDECEMEPIEVGSHKRTKNGTESMNQEQY